MASKKRSEKLGNIMLSSQTPSAAAIASWTDNYFLKTKAIVNNFGDTDVTYAIFMRRPVIFAPQIMLAWLNHIAVQRTLKITIEANFKEGEWAGAGEPLLYLTGSLYQLIDLETVYLQKLGAACIAAYNAFSMCAELPGVSFIDMSARHCAGIEMSELMSYAASVGSQKAVKDARAKGFCGNATNATAGYFGQTEGLGTMPHALIGYAGSTVKAAEMYDASFPAQPLTVLVDYYGQEITDALAVCQRFSKKASSGLLNIRLDTHGGRFVEGLDPQESYAVLERHVPTQIRRYRNDAELSYLTGTGVSAASIFHLREQLDKHGFSKVGIVASSGFDVRKCKVMADAAVPIDIIGTGSFLPTNWSETYATADIVAYGGKPSVKIGREFLLR